VGNRKRPMSESVGTARNQRQREGMVGAGIDGGAVNKDSRLPAQPRQKILLATRGGKHFRTQPHIETVESMHWPRAVHMQTQPHKKRVQALQDRKHLRAQPRKKLVQAMQRIKHLRAQAPKKNVQATCKSCGRSSI
jgi:hypothetical protein